MDKEKLKGVRKIGVMNILSTYNKLCVKCKRKSLRAVRYGGDRLKNILNEYCPECKARVMALEGKLNE